MFIFEQQLYYQKIKLSKMIELKLHANGKKDHLKALKVWFNNQVKLLKARTDLSKKEKTTQLNTLKGDYEKQKKEASQNLY